jgi:ABC-type branched-subunit amino acid transport system substrate-binding protein
MNEWKKKGKADKPKAIFITWDNPFGRGPVDLGTPWAKEYGFEMLQPQYFSSARPTDLTLQISKARDMGANLVFMNSLASHFAVLVKDAQKLGLLDKMQFCGAELSHSDYQIKILGGAAEGMWCTSAPASWPNESKGFKLISKAFRKQGLTFKGMDTILGITWARIGSEAIRAAARKVGPEKVDSNSIFDALINMKDMDMWGLVPNISYSADSRIPFDRCYVHEIKNGMWRDITHTKVPLLSPEH